MVEKAKTNNGFIDQTEFKTADKYIFDTLVLNAEVSTVFDLYIDHIRPLFNPSCNFLFVSTSGSQYQSLTTAKTLLVHQAIGKYINHTGYRQIVETTRADVLSRKGQEIISEDQKHSSTVAKIHYKKKQSRTVALKSKKCMDKMIGVARKEKNNNMSEVMEELNKLRKVNLNSSKITTSQTNSLYEPIDLETVSKAEHDDLMRRTKEALAGVFCTTNSLNENTVGKPDFDVAATNRFLVMLP